MGKKTRSFLSALAVAFAVLFFGPATSKAYAGHRAPFAHARHHHQSFRHAAPFYARPISARPFHRPYRFVRVFVYAPYPHWIYRQVAYGPAPNYAPGYSCSPY